MKFLFLDKEDVLSSIKDDQLFQIIRDDDTLIADKEESAVSMMKSYLNNRYDMPDTFPAITDWDSAKQFLVEVAQTITQRGEEVTYTPKYMRDSQGYILNYTYYNGTFYHSKQNSLGIEPTVAPDWEDYWEERDPRIAIIKEYCIDITIFYLFKRVTPRKIPEFRIDLFNIAKEWLEMVGKGKLSPELPYPLIAEDSIDEVNWGSNYQQEHFW